MKKGIIISLGSILLLGAGYIGGVTYYTDKFTPNTTFAKVDISNLTLSEAQQHIKEAIEKESIVLTEMGQEVGKVSLGGMQYNVDLEEALNVLYQSQDPTTWPVSFFDGMEVQRVLATQSTVDEGQLKAALETIEINNEERLPAVDAKVGYDEENGYYVEPGVQGTQIDSDKLVAAMVNSIESGTKTVALEDTYVDPEINEESPAITETMDFINKVIDTKITLEIADENITIPRELIQKWVYFDQNNLVTVDQEMVREYLTELDEKYSTAGKSREFHSTLQGMVTVPAGILGWSIDIDQEIQNISTDLQRAEDVTRPAAFIGEGLRLGKADDIGSTYIEVDLTNQMMYLYVDGEMIVETNIVSGNLATPTVPGANAVIEKLTNTNLVGYNPTYKKEYSVPVVYWMRFDHQAQGIHDANWQYSFGGDTYVYSGSLGCINTPLEQVATIYEHVDYGTPVLVFE